MRTTIMLVGLLLSVQCAVGADLRLSTGGLGPARFGMTVGQAENALGFSLVTKGAASGDLDCSYVVPQPLIEGLTFMVVKGRVVRIDVREPGIRTLSGIGVGDTEKRVKQRFGSEVEITPHKYLAPHGNYLTIWSANRRSAVRFETDRGKITSFYAGRLPEVTYVEGCA